MGYGAGYGGGPYHGGGGGGGGQERATRTHILKSMLYQGLHFEDFKPGEPM